MYGPEFTGFPLSYMGLIDKVVLTDPSAISPSACAAACVAASTFVCRSFELNTADMKCSLKDVTSYSLLLAGIKLLPMNVDYYQRHCLYVY